MTKALIRLFIKNAEDTRSAAVREPVSYTHLTLPTKRWGLRAICSCSRSS